MEEKTTTHHCLPVTFNTLLLVLTHPRYETYCLSGPSLTIGRDKSNDILLDDPFVSSFHCSIRKEHGTYFVKDLSSLNGTKVNGVRIRDVPLWPGARIGIGSATLVCINNPGRSSRYGLDRLVGTSKPMKRFKSELSSFAAKKFPIFINGESGTGKDLAAEAIHELSAQNQGPYVAVNCGELTPQLGLSELFGHEQGAFTSAVKTRRGAFERAHNGTLFLDEIGELDLKVQAALLRVLETGKVKRLGSEREMVVNVRLITATNRDLITAIKVGAFRLDLYHRLAVLSIKLPPLRNRTSDIPDLAKELLRRSHSFHSVSAEAMELLQKHQWPGNVRELRNLLERAHVLAEGKVITSTDLRFDGLEFDEASDEAKSLFRIVEEHNGSVAAAARALGIPRTTLRDRVQKIKGTYRRGLR